MGIRAEDNLALPLVELLVAAANRIIDLDGLKELNDREGHHAGDAFLCLAAEVLRQTVGPTDVIARTGGDEFAVLVSPAQEVGATALAARLRDKLHAVGIGHAVGSSTVREGEPLATTWVRADRRMYADKAARTGAAMRQR
ncbi:MAG: GGDEF domain-containing protein [Acidimicrobiales bacterium]